MTPFEDDLSRSLRSLEPVAAVTEGQWQENRARLGRSGRPRLSAGVLAASVAAVVTLLIAGTVLLLQHGGSGSPAGPPDQPGGTSSPSCSSLTDAKSTVIHSTQSPMVSIRLQFTPDPFDPLLCVSDASAIGRLDLDPAQKYSTELLSVGDDSTWFLALGQDDGDTAAKVIITTSDGQVRTLERSAAVVDVGGRPVFAVDVGSRPAWARTEFLDAQGRRLQMSKMTRTTAPTRSEALSTEASLSAAAAATSSEPSTYLPPFGPDLSCLPKSAAPTPEYWLVLSCSGTPQNTTLWFGHGGTPVDNDASAAIGADVTKTFPYLSQMGMNSDVLVSAFPAETATAVLTLTDGKTVTFGDLEHPWITLRSGWKGMVYLGNSPDRVERVAAFGANQTRLGTQELFY